MNHLLMNDIHRLLIASFGYCWSAVARIWLASQPGSQPANQSQQIRPSIKTSFGRNIVRAMSLREYRDFPVMFSDMWIVSRSSRNHDLIFCECPFDVLPSMSFASAAHLLPISWIFNFIFGLDVGIFRKLLFSWNLLQSLPPFQEPSGAPGEPRWAQVIPHELRWSQDDPGWCEPHDPRRDDRR